MGCGSSSLKGDDVPNVNSQPVTTSPSDPQAVKKVKTNFSDIDYDQDNRTRRLTEYAPHEQPAPVREESYDSLAQQHAAQASSSQQGYQNDDGISPDRPDPNAGTSASYLHEGAGPGSGPVDGEHNTTLKPYQTFDGGDWDASGTSADQYQHQVPYTNGTHDSNDPTSSLAKDEFASTNDPANPLNQESHHNGNHQSPSPHNSEHFDPNDDTSPGSNPEHKKSWLGQKYASYQSTKRGTGPSDEDVQQYTGKDKNELSEWARERQGVAGNQDAGRVGTDSGLAAGAAWN